MIFASELVQVLIPEYEDRLDVIHSPRPPRPSLSAKVFQLIARVAPNATVIYHAPNPGGLVCVIRYHADLSWLRDELEWLRQKHGTCQVEWRFEQ